MHEAAELDIDSAMDQVAAGIDTATLDDGADDAGAESPAPIADSAAPALDDIPMPQSWKKEWEPDWKATPKTARERFIEREKQMLAGLEGYKGDAGYGRQLRDAFKPYADLLKQQGVDEVKAVQYLLNAHQRLSNAQTPAEQRMQYLHDLAKSYGITLAGQPTTTTEDTHPALKAALDRLQRVEGVLTEQQQREQEQRIAATKSEVDAFASDPAHPYFDECSDHIAKLITAGYSLKDAYEAAVWANPVTRQKELGRMEKEKAEAAKKKALEIARQARKGTAVNVKGRDTAHASTEPAGSVEDTLRETLADIKSRTN